MIDYISVENKLTVIWKQWWQSRLTTHKYVTMDREVVCRLKEDLANSALLSKKYGKELRGKKYILWTVKSRFWSILSILFLVLALPNLWYTSDHSKTYSYVSLQSNNSGMLPRTSIHSAFVKTLMDPIANDLITELRCYEEALEAKEFCPWNTTTCWD